MPTTSSPAPILSSPYLPKRFFGLLISSTLAACAGWAALVLASSPWQQARQLDDIFPFYNWRIRWFTAAELCWTWQALLVLAAVLGGGAIALAAPAAGRLQIRVWRNEICTSMANLWGELSALSTKQRQISGLVFSILTALRFWLSQTAVTPGYDDVPSYELFASKSLLAVSAYYPVPNNHVLSNTLSWLCYHVNPGFWFTMRLPVLLAATTATGLLFAGLLKMRTGFWVALLTVGMFGLAQLSLYHGAVGRGYWLLTLLASIVFFCVLALCDGTQQPRATWTGLLIGGVLGMFTVPTFALVLASAFSWLGLNYLRLRNGAALGQLAGVAFAVMLGSLLLYTPLLFISGPASFLHNGFVTPLPSQRFWAEFPAYWWETEGFLAGQMKVGAVLTLIVLGAAALGLHRIYTGFPMPRLAAWHRLAPVALWFVLLPYAMLAVQRVFAPGRALMYKAFFFFVLLNLALDWLMHLRPPSQQRSLRVLLGLGLILWTSYQLISLMRDNRKQNQHNIALHAAFDWLVRHPRGPILIPEPTHSLFVRMYLHSELPGQIWDLDARPRPGTRYTYVLAFPDQRGQFQPRLTVQPVFHNEQVNIYLAPAIAPATYWYLAN